MKRTWKETLGWDNGLSLSTPKQGHLGQRSWSSNAHRRRRDHGRPPQDDLRHLRRSVLWPPVRGVTQFVSTSWVGRATGVQPSSYRLPGPVPVHSATFAGMKSWMNFMGLGQSGVSGMITMASDSHLGA